MMMIRWKCKRSHGGRSEIAGCDSCDDDEDKMIENNEEKDDW